jgi:integrase
VSRKRRSRRPEGHVYRRGRIWWFKWVSADHRTYFRSSNSADRAVAEQMLREELQRKARGQVAASDPRRCRVDDLLEGLKARYRTEGHRSLGRVELSCRHLLRLFAGVAAVRVTGADVTRYAELRLKDNAAPATVNRELGALRAAYRLGIRNEVIPAMPYIRLLPERNVRKGFASAEQIDAICRHLKEPEADAVRFMFITGWRSRSEVQPLTWAQVDWADGFVHLNPGTTKNMEGRAFPLIPELRRVLQRRLEATRHCEVAQGRIIAEVFHRFGRPLKAMRRSWATACRKAGAPGLILHDLRRSAVRNLERAGISRSVAMKLTGHKTESIYRRYAIVADGDLIEAGAKLSATIFPRSVPAAEPELQDEPARRKPAQVYALKAPTPRPTRMRASNGWTRDRRR